MIVSPYKPQWTWRSLLYISAAAAENIRDSYFWGELPQFCSPALCVFSTLTWTCVLPHSGLPVICTVVNTLLQSAVISRSCGTQNEMTEIYYRTWEILENVQVDHCEVHGKTLTAEDKTTSCCLYYRWQFPTLLRQPHQQIKLRPIYSVYVCVYNCYITTPFTACDK